LGRGKNGRKKIKKGIFWGRKAEGEVSVKMSGLKGCQEIT